MQRSSSHNALLPTRPLPLIPPEPSSASRGRVADVDDDIEVEEDRRAPEPELPGEVERAHPPEELFAIPPTEHIVLPPRRNNLHIAVAAFVLMLLFSLLAAFFRHRLQMEHEDEVDVKAPSGSVDTVLAR